MSSWPWPWTHALYSAGSLSSTGLFLAAILVVCYFLVNFWGVRLFAKANSAITVLKFIVPALTVAGLMLTRFDSSNLGSITHADGVASTFAPFGWSAVFTAVATSGIVFAFNGFQSPVNLAGEARNPARSVPFAVIGSIVLALIIYVLLQVAFIGSLAPADIARGWAALDFSSPFANLAIALGLNWLALTLYLDAFISPSGTGITYTATTGRMIQAMERNKSLPAFLGGMHPLYRVPRAAMWFNLGICFLFLFFFRGWSSLAAVISVATVISYLTGPVSLMALRRHAPNLKRPFVLPGMGVIAPVAFVCASLILYWARWPLTGQIILLMVVALPVYFYYQAKTGWQGWQRELTASYWLIAYLPTMAVLSYIGGKAFGGLGMLPEGWDMLVVAVVAFGFYRWGVHSGYHTPYLDEAEGAQQ